MHRRKSALILWLVVSFSGIVKAQTAEDYLAKAQDYHNSSQPDSAVYFYQKGVLSYFHNGRKVESLNYAVDVADVFYAQRDYERGLLVLNVVLDQSLKYNNEEERTALLEAQLYKAYGLEQQGKFLEAKNAYESARLKLVEKVEYENFYVARYLYQPLGNIYTRLGELEEALKLLEKFKEISVANKEYIAAAQAYNDVGIIYKSLGRYDEVIADYETALDFPGLDAMTRGLLLSNLSAAYYEILQTNKAKKSAELSISDLNDALAEGQSVNEIFSYLSLVYSTLGKIYTSSGDEGEAMQNFKTSVELAEKAYGTSKRREVAKIYISMGYLFLVINSPNDALQMYQKALSCVIPGFPPDDIDQNPGKKELYPENSIFEALDGKSRAYEMLYKKNHQAEFLKKAVDCFDLIFQVEMQLRQNYLNESSKLLLAEESHRRGERALNTVYELYLETKDPGYVGKAFQMAERNKATVLLESLKTLKISDFANIPDSLLRLERRLKTNVALLKKSMTYEQLKGAVQDSARARSLSDELFANEKALQQLNATFQREFPRYFRLKNLSFEDVDPEKVRNEIVDGHSQLVEYYLGEESLFTFSLTKGEMEMTKTEIDSSLSNAVQQMLNKITVSELYKSDPRELANLAYQLYQVLVVPVIKDDKQALRIIPDGIIGYLPFDLLVEQKVENPKFNTLPYLVRSKNISYGYSAAVLLENENPLKDLEGQRSFLGMAPIFTNSSTFRFLPFSEEEVKSAQKELGGQVYLGEDATKSVFKKIASQYQVIHLSSHASVVDSLPLYSWISFSDTSAKTEDDYKLYLTELYSMKLNADLAVLSACETGAGTISSGEGIMSLARGFTYAGCNSIVTTLWQVNDGSTSTIMTRFYHHLEEGRSKDEALRLAKLDYLNGDDIDQFGAHPFFWAAYVPIGNMSPITHQNEKMTYVWYLLGVLVILTAAFGFKKWKRG